MKLIIDIPDSDYTAVRCEGLYYIGHDKLAESVTTAFQTAAPYEERLQGDLVSREALKRVIKIECNPYGAPTIDFESGKRVLKLIDNVPPVRPCKNCDLYFKAMTKEEQKGGADCMDEDAKQASIPYTYNAPQHDWKCGYPDITRGKGGAE